VSDHSHLQRSLLDLKRLSVALNYDCSQFLLSLSVVFCLGPVLLYLKTKVVDTDLIVSLCYRYMEKALVLLLRPPSFASCATLQNLKDCAIFVQFCYLQRCFRKLPFIAQDV
jgi:hypothetical protein